jgi:DNA transposition AAA+ family ATPase
MNPNHGEGAQETLVGAFRWCCEHHIPLKDFARRIGVSDNQIYCIYKNAGAYQDRPVSATTIAAIERFLELEQERLIAPMDFVMTPTAADIYTLCDLARESQTPAWLMGPSHVGKTWALRHYANNPEKNHGRTFLIEFDAASGLGGMVRQIAKGCGIGGWNSSNTAKLIKRIKRVLTPNTLPIFDEVHLLKHTYRLNSFFACLEVIRRLIDFAGCGAVLSWTHLDEVNAAKDGELVQLWRRGVHKRILPNQPTVGDVKAICTHHRLVFPAKTQQVTVGEGKHAVTEIPYQILRQVGANEGLKAICERIRYAKKLAERSKSRVAWTHFVDAHLRIAKQSTPDAGGWE